MRLNLMYSALLTCTLLQTQLIGAQTAARTIMATPRFVSGGLRLMNVPRATMKSAFMVRKLPLRSWRRLSSCFQSSTLMLYSSTRRFSSPSSKGGARLATAYSFA